MRQRRFEIHFQRKSNDGQPVGEESLYPTREELMAQLGALGLQPNGIHGVWINDGDRYEDELARFVVDVEDTAENLQFFVNLKKLLIERFRRVGIYILSLPVIVV